MTKPHVAIDEKVHKKLKAKCKKLGQHMGAQVEKLILDHLKGDK